MKTYFSEKQNFVQPWLYIPLAIAWIWLLVKFIERKSFNNEFLISVIALGLATLLVFLLRLETVVDSEGIGYRWFPSQPTFTRVPWRRIERVEVRKYSAIGGFGGWRIRFNRKKTAYNTKGTFGFEIFFTDKKGLS